MIPWKQVEAFKAMRTSGIPFEEALSRLRADGVTIVQSMAIVKEAQRCELAEAKRLVHTSRTWRDVAEATEKMWDDALDELKKKKA